MSEQAMSLRGPAVPPSPSLDDDEAAALTQHRCGALDFQVFLHLSPTRVAGEFTAVNAGALAGRLGTQAPNVSASLRFLVSINALLKGGREAGSWTYMCNPAFARP